MKIKQETFFIILGCSLVLAAILLWIKTKTGESLKVPDQQNTYLADAATGAGIGFLSGMVGIGGGIFLSPLLNLAKWDRPKKIAATASVFILVNSISGIAGQLTQLPPKLDFPLIGGLSFAVFAGGQTGSRFGAIKFNEMVIRRLTAALVFVAGVEVLVKHIF